MQIFKYLQRVRASLPPIIPLLLYLLFSRRLLPVALSLQSPECSAGVKHIECRAEWSRIDCDSIRRENLAGGRLVLLSVWKMVSVQLCEAGKKLLWRQVITACTLLHDVTLVRSGKWRQHAAFIELRVFLLVQQLQRKSEILQCEDDRSSLDL